MNKIYKLEKIGHFAKIEKEIDKEIYYVCFVPMNKDDSFDVDSWFIAGVEEESIFDTYDLAKEFINLELNQETKNDYPILDIDDLIEKVKYNENK